MSNKQLTVLWFGVCLIVLMCLFPPWLDRGEKALGYRFILTQEIGQGEYIYKTIRIDSRRLIFQCVVVVLLTGAGIYTLRVKGK